MQSQGANNTMFNTPAAATTPAPKPTAPSMQAQEESKIPASARGTGSENDPVVEEIEDLGFSSSQSQASTTAPTVNPFAAMQGMGAGGMPPMGGMPGMPGGGNMADMMNNPMVKEMMNNPDMMKMAQQMMGGMGGAGGGAPDPSKMQEMMKNPSMAKLLDNPEFLDSTLGMLKSPMARPQVEAMATQMNISPDNMIRVLEWLVSAGKAFKKVKNVVTNPIIKYGLIILVVSYLLFWFGFTKVLLFMVPFRGIGKEAEEE